MDRLTMWSNPDRRSSATMSRMTVDGRRLTYKLTVIQQPEKARACGNGAKASADRRPVDPPPVVELRIFEGSDDNLKDITIAFHNVSFFLFATLESRPIAQGRVHTPGPPSVAVLNGCNVAGINYLERPQPAGYFIFPDLSVRHEGYYRLNFGLYEILKEANDAEPSLPFPSGPLEPHDKDNPKPPRMHEAAIQRLEVRSEEFQVYSAKKFPGLDRSTGLSIGLSDQGCRVRIRRDVRMRKRPKVKNAPEPPQYADAGMRGRFVTPESLPLSHDRARSMSHSSRAGSQYDGRRLSVHTGDGYQAPASAGLGPSVGMNGNGFALPATPGSAPVHPSHTYAGPSPYASPTTLHTPASGVAPRAQDYAPKPSQYNYPSRPNEQAVTYPVAEPPTRRMSEGSGYGPTYNYAPANQQTIMPEPSPAETRLPPVRDLLRESDARQNDLHSGKRSYSPPRYTPQPLKSGMRPSNSETYDETQSPSFPGVLEYKRANGGYSHIMMSQRY